MQRTICRPLLYFRSYFAEFLKKNSDFTSQMQPMISIFSDQTVWRV